MKKCSSLFLSLFLFNVICQAQTLVGYWDLNNTLVRSDGFSGSLNAEVEGFGFPSFINFGSGTTINLPTGFVAGQSLRFFDLASIVEVDHITISNLNFTGLSSPTLSFAARSNALFQAGDDFKIEYNIGSGWITSASPVIDTTYSLFSHTFGAGILDGVSSADIRITFSTVVTVADVFEVDNIQVTAVPEPLTIGLLAVCAFVLISSKLLKSKRWVSPFRNQ